MPGSNWSFPYTWSKRVELVIDRNILGGVQRTRIPKCKRPRREANTAPRKKLIVELLRLPMGCGPLVYFGDGNSFGRVVDRLVCLDEVPVV